MHYITLTDAIKQKRLKVDLVKHTKETFLQEVKTYFETEDLTTLDIEEVFNIPSIFRTPEDVEIILSDSFWSWKSLEEHDQKLLSHYMEISQDNKKTIEEARRFRSSKSQYITSKR
jgi:hypothetical protein